MLARRHNDGMKVKAFLGWGIVIYALMFLTSACLNALNLISAGSMPPVFLHIVQLLVLIAIATIAGRSLRYADWRDILPYSVSWACIAALFDGLLFAPYGGWDIYLNGDVWMGYILLVLLPLLAPKTRRPIEAAL